MIQFRPGDQIKTFNILEKKLKDNGHGRITTPIDPVSIGILNGTLASAGQKEIDQWKQNGHPITHTIVVMGTTEAKAESVLQLTDNLSRKFYVQGKTDPGELGIYQILYCEERPGV